MATESSFGGGMLSQVSVLTAKAKAGDELAFKDLVDRFYCRVYRYAFVSTNGNEPLAHEIAQETLLRFYRRLTIFPSEETLWFWLAKVARNLVIDSVRAKRKQQRFHLLFERFHEQTSILLPDDTWNEVLSQALKEISEADRSIIDAFYINHEPLSKIAENAGGTYKALESRLQRIRVRLREICQAKIKNE